MAENYVDNAPEVFSKLTVADLKCLVDGEQFAALDLDTLEKTFLVKGK